MDMMTAPVGVERRLDIAAFADLGKHFFQQLLPLFSLAGPGSIKIIEFFQALGLLFQDILIVGRIELSAVQLFHGHKTVPPAGSDASTLSYCEDFVKLRRKAPVIWQDFLEQLILPARNLIGRITLHWRGSA